MLIDLTLEITGDMLAKDKDGTSKAPSGHIGTHFDLMHKTFPLEYAIRKGIVIDVTDAIGTDGEIDDIDLSDVEEGMFVAFRTGWIEKYSYTDPLYHHDHPQLSHALIDRLLEKGTAIIGFDASGIRRGKEHTPADQKCADHGCFVVENMVSLSSVLQGKKRGSCTMYTFPLSCNVFSGLPSRVLAEI